MKRHLFASSLALVVIAATSVANAQDTLDPNLLASRREMVDRATQARNAGRHEEALDLATRAGRIQMTPSLRLFVSQEQQAVGQLAEAMGSALQCQSEASRDTAASGRQVERICGEIITQLRSRVGRVLVTVSNPPVGGGMHVFVANRELPAMLLGNDYVVTPGDVIVRVIAPDFQEYSSNVRVLPGTTVPLVVTLVRSSAAAVANTTTTTNTANTSNTTGPTTTVTNPTANVSGTSTTGTATVAVGTGAGTVTTTTVATTTTVQNTANSATNPNTGTVGSTTNNTVQDPIVPPPPSRGANIPAIALLAAGGAIAVTGAVFLGLSAGSASEYNRLCTPTCTLDNEPMGRAAYDTANTFTAIGIAGIAVGVAAAGAGVVLLVAGGRPAPATAQANHGLRLGLGALSFSGTF